MQVSVGASACVSHSSGQCHQKNQSHNLQLCNLVSLNADQHRGLLAPVVQQPIAQTRCPSLEAHHPRFTVMVQVSIEATARVPSSSGQHGMGQLLQPSSPAVSASSGSAQEAARETTGPALRLDFIVGSGAVRSFVRSSLVRRPDGCWSTKCEYVWG